MLKLHVGLSNEPDPPSKGGYLLIADEVPKLPDWKRAKIFDPHQHHFNPLEGLDYRRACDVVAIFDAAFTRGETTLTKDMGLDFIADALEKRPESLASMIEEPEKRATPGHLWAYSKVRKILRSPVLSKALCTPSNSFALKSSSVILARVNRAELGDDDSLLLGLFLMAHYKGQLVIRDLGFYGRDVHISLIRENRLIAGVNSLGKLPKNLRDELLLMKDKIAQGAKHEDAVTLAMESRLIPQTNAFNDFVTSAMA